MTFEGAGGGAVTGDLVSGLVGGWLVIIGVREVYRQDGMVAMRMGCAEVAGAVENVWNAGIPAGMGRFAARGMWKTFVPRGTIFWLQRQGVRSLLSF